MEFNLKETLLKQNFILETDEYWDTYTRKFEDGHVMEFELDKNGEPPIFTMTIRVPEDYHVDCENSKNVDSIGSLIDYFELPSSERDVLLMIAVGEQLKIHMTQYHEMKRHYFK